MDVKIKSKEDFKNYYYNDYRKSIEEYYKIISDEENSIIVSRLVIFVILDILFIIAMFVLNFKSYVGSNFIVVCIFYFVISFLILMFSARISLRNSTYRMNEWIIKDIISFISENSLDKIMFEPNKMVSKESFSQMDLFNLDMVKYTGNNYIKVPYNKNDLVFSDMETYTINIVKNKEVIYKDGKRYIRTTRRKEKSTIFKGLYIGANLNKNNTNHIYLIPNNLNDVFLQSKILNYIDFHGVRVNLENLDFSKKYMVLCDDEIAARYILSLSLMEKINKLDDIFKCKKYIVFKAGKRFTICLEGITIESIKMTKIPYFFDEDKTLDGILNIFNKINSLFSIYYVLDLGNDLYAPNKVNLNQSSNGNSIKNNIMPVNGGSVQSKPVPKKLLREYLSKNFYDYNSNNNISNASAAIKYLNIIVNYMNKFAYPNNSNYILSGNDKIIVDEINCILSGKKQVGNTIFYVLGKLQELMCNSNFIGESEPNYILLKEKNDNYMLNGYICREEKNTIFMVINNIRNYCSSSLNNKNSSGSSNIQAYKICFLDNFNFIININKKLGPVQKYNSVSYKVGNNFNIMIAKCSGKELFKQRSNEWLAISAKKNNQIICNDLDAEYTIRSGALVYEKTVMKDNRKRFYKFVYFNSALLIFGYSNAKLSSFIDYSISTIRK